MSRRQVMAMRLPAPHTAPLLQLPLPAALAA
jgi:hypothetical protein